MNEETGAELIGYDLGEDFSSETAIFLAEVYRNGTEWNFSGVGRLSGWIHCAIILT